MVSAYVKILVALLALAGATASQAQSFPFESDGAASAKLSLESPVSSSGGAAIVPREGTIMVATIATASRLPVEKPMGEQDPASTGPGLDGWMLIVIGVFLIGSVFQRRLRAMTG